MGKPVLLLVWILVPRFYHPRHIVLANRYCYGLLSIMRRGNYKLQNILEVIADFHSFSILSRTGLQLVVAQFRRFGRFSHLCVRVRRFLLFHSTGNHRVHPHSALFRLHWPHVRYLLALDGHNRLLCGVLFRAKDLCLGENRLTIII